MGQVLQVLERSSLRAQYNLSARIGPSGLPCEYRVVVEGAGRVQADLAMVAE